MALYKVEYWVQYENNEQPEMRHNDIYSYTSDRGLKAQVSKVERFYPEFSTPWKEIGDEPDFQSWSRSIKQSTLKKWNEKFGIGEKKRFVIIRKAVTDKSNEQLKNECHNRPRRPYKY